MMSIGLAIALVGLTSLSLALLLLPLLLRRGRQTSREAYNLAVYRDQLAEVDRDLGRGVLNAEQAEAARAEIGRRILALDPMVNETAANPKALAAAVVGILVLPIAALLLYAQLGSPALPDRSLAARAAAADNAPPLDMRQAMAQIRAHLKEHPDDLKGWLLLARSEMSLGHYEQAVEAYGHAADLSGHRADIVGDWGEAQVLAAGGQVTPAAREAFTAGLKNPEAAPRSRYYLGLAQLQQGDAKGALEAWQNLEAEAPTDAEWLPMLQRRIAEAKAALGEAKPAPSSAGGTPSAAAVAGAEQASADASPQARQAMIEGMVARLAARLEQQPDDLDGWVRLGRSYMVLNQPAKARAAYARAVNLKPDDAALQQDLQRAEAAVAQAGAQGKPQ